jgi:hypothetical protein
MATRKDLLNLKRIDNNGSTDLCSMQEGPHDRIWHMPCV